VRDYLIASQNQTITMHKVFFILLFSSVVLISCKKDYENIPPALRYITSEHPGCICEPYLNEYLWRNQTVFVLLEAGIACDTRPIFYNENGEEFNMEQGYTFEMFQQESVLVKRIWTCKE